MEQADMLPSGAYEPQPKNGMSAQKVEYAQQNMICDPINATINACLHEKEKKSKSPLIVDWITCFLAFSNVSRLFVVPFSLTMTLYLSRVMNTKDMIEPTPDTPPRKPYIWHSKGPKILWTDEIWMRKIELVSRRWISASKDAYQVW